MCIAIEFLKEQVRRYLMAFFQLIMPVKGSIPWSEPVKNGALN